MSATLRLHRELGFGVELRRGRFDVLVDGVTVGSVESHETFETQLEPGPHVLCVRHGRYSSRDRSFVVGGDEVIDFRCHGVGIWPMYVASIVKPNLAITLKRAS